MTKTKKQIRAALHREWRKDYEYYVEISPLGERCAICGRTPPMGKRLCIDSDHSTDTPRGLLCHSCNRKLRWNYYADWMRKAADYLDDPPFENK